MTSSRALTLGALCMTVACADQAANDEGACGELLPGLSAAPFDSSGVLVVPMDPYRVLDACQLTPVLDVRLGDADGPGMVEGDGVTLRYDASAGLYFVAWSGGPASPIDVFDSRGTYVDSIGRRGQGPGEFAYSPSRFIVHDGLVTVPSYPGRTWTTFQPDGTLVKQWTSEVLMQPDFLWVAPDTALITGGTTPTSRHVIIEVSSGRVIKELPNSILGVQTGGRIRPPEVARGRGSRTIATAETESLLIQEWSWDHELLSVFRGAPSGFPELGGRHVVGEPPRSRIQEFAFDGAARLWVITMVPADTWQEFAAALSRHTGGATGPVEIQVRELFVMPRQLAPRLDIFDLERGVHLGSWTSPARLIQLLEREGELLVYQMETDERGNPVVGVYRML